MIAADGYVDETRNLFVLTSKDKEILYKFLLEIQAEGLKLSRDDGNYENSKECYSVRLSSKELVYDLNKWGIFHNKSLSYNKVPKIPKQFLWDYLRGYIDGDGSAMFSQKACVIKNKKYVYPNLTLSFIATKEFIKDVAKIFEIKNYSIAKSHTKGMFYMRISKKSEILRMYPLLYNKNSNCYFSRKKEKWDKYLWALNQK